MMDLNYYSKLFKKINIKCDKEINIRDFEIHLNDYLHFLLIHENVVKINSMSLIIKNFFLKKMDIFDSFEINSDEKAALLSLILFKSINKTAKWPTIRNINSTSSDHILNETIMFYKNINIFYNNIEPTHDEIHLFKGNLFRLIKILIIEKIVECEQIFYNNKTIEKWSFNLNDIYQSDFEITKISTSPFRLIFVNENYYLVGNFFIFIKKIFVENIKSEYFFKLNDFSYIANLTNNKIYLNMFDLEKILSVFSEENINRDNIMTTVMNNNNRMLTNLNEIRENKKNIKNILLSNVKRIVSNDCNLRSIDENFLKTEQYLIDIFYEYCASFIQNKYGENLGYSNKQNFLLVLYEIFKEKFQNAYVKFEFNSLDDLLEWSKKFTEYDIEISEEDINETAKFNTKTYDNKQTVRQFKKIDSANKQKILKKIVKKIDPNSISMLTFILIYSKNEIDLILKKWKKIKKKIPAVTGELGIQEKTLKKYFEKKDAYSDNYVSLVISILLKFDTNIKKNKEIKEIKNNLRNLINDNKALFSENSKLSHINDIFLLYDYCCKNELMISSASVNKNIEVYFMFYFDFRGRFYYDSPVSPTNNRYCRFIYNYGTIDISTAVFNPTKLSVIIENYWNYIGLVKKIFNIDSDFPIVNEAIFWLMISIGKIKINKNIKHIGIKEFLDSAVCLLNKTEILTDRLDKVEFYYYLASLHSLKNEKVLQRCLVKDATASFFQNLIRILGSKNDDIAKVANLQSTTHWYDWYTYILEKWKEQEIKSNSNNYEYLSYFTRKSIKKIVMTFPYNATFPTCFEYFQENLSEQFKKSIESGDDIDNAFKRFYSFLSDSMKKNTPFAESPEKIIEHFKFSLKTGEPVLVISRDDDLSNLTYYKTSTKHFDFIIRWHDTKKRIIKNYSEIDRNEIDKRKTTTALKANLVHFVDALLVRDINKSLYKRRNVYYLSIHDSFMTNFMFTSEFIMIANKEFNRKTFKEEIWINDKDYFSIFIFL